jgi:NADH:ubiquinone oxidoreductase subunit 3 (subunit A)
MLADYVGILVICAAGALLIAAMLAAHLLLRPKRDLREQTSTSTTGEREMTPPDSPTVERLFLLAVLFVVFEIAAMLLYPWAAVFTEVSWFGYGAILVFSLPLGVGLFYQWLKGGLEW